MWEDTTLNEFANGCDWCVCCFLLGDLTCTPREGCLESPRLRQHAGKQHCFSIRLHLEFALCSAWSPGIRKSDLPSSWLQSCLFLSNINGDQARREAQDLQVPSYWDQTPQTHWNWWPTRLWQQKRKYSDWLSFVLKSFSLVDQNNHMIWCVWQPHL